jgi:hypothetical protein
MTVDKQHIIVNGWDLPLSVDQVIWSQGADPAVMRQRRPQVMRIAEDVVQQEAGHLAPVLLYRRIPVKGFWHNRLELEGGSTLQGQVLAENLAAAEEIVIAIYTVGETLDERLTLAMKGRLPYALALDALGTAAVDELGRQVQAHFKSLAQVDGKKVSMCFSPGMLGWELAEGQLQIFDLIDAGLIGVHVADTGRMTPRKTISAIFGLGSMLTDKPVSPCEFCAVQDHCQYRGRYGEFAALHN